MPGEALSRGVADSFERVRAGDFVVEGCVEGLKEAGRGGVALLCVLGDDRGQRHGVAARGCLEDVERDDALDCSLRGVERDAVCIDERHIGRCDVGR